MTRCCRAIPTTTTVKSSAAAAESTIARYLRKNLAARYTGVRERAFTGRPSMNAFTSAASSDIGTRCRRKCVHGRTAGKGAFAHACISCCQVLSKIPGYRALGCRGAALDGGRCWNGATAASHRKTEGGSGPAAYDQDSHDGGGRFRAA